MIFSLRTWGEALESLVRHPLRSGLTAFGVCWGMFMLTLLIGIGKSFQNGASKQFEDDAIDSFWGFARRTTLPYPGSSPGTPIKLTLDDLNLISEEIPELTHITPRTDYQGEGVVSFGNNSDSFYIVAGWPGYMVMEKCNVVKGRLMSQRDLDSRAPICFIGYQVASALITDGSNPIGQHILIDGIPLKIAGVYEDNGGEDENLRIILPYSAYQDLFDPSPNFGGRFGCMLPENMTYEQAESRIMELLSPIHHFDPNDTRAFRSWSPSAYVERTRALFKSITLLLMAVGIGTLAGGMVGVSNIMLVTVSERTKEIGVRKALGATPVHIITQILQEAGLITISSGVIGLLAGIITIETIAKYNLINMLQSGDTNFFGTPEIPANLIIFGLIGLILCGLLAGLFPALRAARILPVEALRKS